MHLSGFMMSLLKTALLVIFGLLGANSARSMAPPPAQGTKSLKLSAGGLCDGNSSGSFESDRADCEHRKSANAESVPDAENSEECGQKGNRFYKFLLNGAAKTSPKFVEENDEIRLATPGQAKLPENRPPTDKFHWSPAIKESFYFLGIQHSLRMLQKKTRRELNGQFFGDWGTSVRSLGGWRDGDSFLTNYIAHPMQGAVTGRIFINNSDKSKKLDFGTSQDYWESRFKAMAWSAVWSTQFELGPISEASIGNVGLYDKVGPNRMGWVDLVVTPVAGTGVLIGEDMIDKFILKKWLEKSRSRTRIKIYRTFFTPIQSFTNVLRGKVPWKRDNR